MELYLNNGMFERHAKEVRETYRRRMEELIRACRAELPPGPLFTLPGFPLRPFLRLSVIRTDEAAIRRGVAIAAAARRLLRTSTKERDAAERGLSI